MGTKQQLLDSLTAHISLYHCREAIQTSNSSTRSAVLRWFSSLSVHQRRAHLTVLDYKFVKILLQMREKLKSHGHGRFIILPDLPQHDSNLPTVCFRKSEGLLARVAESGSAKVEIYRSVELFSSTEGERGREGNEPLCLDAMCLAEGLVKDVDKFVKIMDEITNGEFLGGGEEAKVTEEWVELGWLKAKGYYSLEEFVVNRLEIALVLAWLNSNSGKKKGAKLKEKLSAAGVAANLFWRKKGCLDWWEKLDDSMRKRLYRAYLGKAAPSLTAYMVKHRPFFSDDTNWRRHSPSLSRKGIGTFTGTSSRAKSPASVAEVHGNRNSLYYIFDSLYVLQGISSLLSTAQTDGCDQEKLFFSSLDSVNSISDIILRQLREILLVVSLDCTKLELLGEENMKLDMKKLNEKPVASSRKKKSKNNSKKSNVISRHFFDDSKPDRPTKDKENKIMYTSTEGFKASNYYDNRVPAKDPVGGNNSSANAMEPAKGVTNGKLRGALRKNRKEMKKRKNSVPQPSEVGDCQSKSTGVSSSFINSEDRPCMSDLTSGSSTLANVSKNIVFQSNLDHMGNGHSSEADQSFCLKYHVDTTGNDSLNSELDSGSTTIEPVVKCNYSKCKTTIVSRCNAEDYLGKRIKDGEMEGKSSLIHDPASRSFLRVRAINSPAYVSYEWPNIGPIHPLTTTHLPAATDRLHLDVGHNLQTRFHRSFVQNLHVRNSAIEKIYSGIARPLPVKVDWSPAVHGVDRFVPPVLATPASTCNYYSEFIPRRQSSFQNVQCGTTTSEDEKTVSGEVVDFTDGTGTQEIVDEGDRHWMSEEESETHAVSMMDYNQYFGGGVMYWNPSDYPGNSFSRPPSLCSDDSSWAWREADLTRAVDDMVTFSSSYSGLTSPSAASFCSPFDPLGPGSLGYVLPGSEISSKVLHTSSKMAELGAEESISGSTFKVSSDGEMKTVDTLPYPVLRPIIVPNMSRERSRSEFRHSYDHKSPCVPTNRREQPRVKRPPSPVVLCVPSAPCPPPPSPESDSRKHRGFSTVRSGSSSPRHWGMKGSFHDGDNSEESCMDIAGSEVVWPTWRSKGIQAHQLIQPFSGKLLQDRLVAIAQLARDHDHPDITLPLQPPESQNCSAGNIYLPMIHNILHDEIDTFCKKVAAENLIRKRDINWAVKRVARSLQVLWPRSRTNIFGSNATGLALPSSDVDLVVCLPPVRNLEPIKEAGILEGRNGIKETCLQHAARYLGNQEWVKSDSLKVVENTAIPIIMLVVEVPHDTISDSSTIPKLKESADHAASEDGNPSQAGATCSSGTTSHVQSKIRDDIDDGFKPVRLDISFKSPTHSGLQTTGLVKNLTEQFPAVTPLALVLKQFLADRGLYQSYSGGLSSYCLILLITRFLQHEHHHGRPTNQNYGSLLMDFLYFFGNVFDPRQMRVSVQGAGVYLNRERGCSIDPLCIDDPLFLTDNVGRNCFRIHQCIKAFGDAYAMMMNELTIISSDNKTYDKSTHKLLPKLIPSLSHLLGS